MLKGAILRCIIDKLSLQLVPEETGVKCKKCLTVVVQIFISLF